MKRRPIASLVVGALLLVIAQAHAQTDRLPSWSDGPAKKAIEFTQRSENSMQGWQEAAVAANKGDTLET
jgi:hypothetical protein